MNVLKPDRDDPAWDEFVDALSSAIVPGRCMGDGTGRHYFARWLLTERGYDVEASLALYETKGGYCDCEILLNVDLVLSGPDDAAALDSDDDWESPAA